MTGLIGHLTRGYTFFAPAGGALPGYKAHYVFIRVDIAWIPGGEGRVRVFEVFLMNERRAVDERVEPVGPGVKSAENGVAKEAFFAPKCARGRKNQEFGKLVGFAGWKLRRNE